MYAGGAGMIYPGLGFTPGVNVGFGLLIGGLIVPGFVITPGFVIVGFVGKLLGRIGDVLRLGFGLGAEKSPPGKAPGRFPNPGGVGVPGEP
jgi:hypothetical protein